MMQILKVSALCVMIAALAAPAQAYEAKGFIRVCNGKFADAAGKQILFAGWNGYTNLLNDAYDYLYNGQPDRVSARFKSARASKLNLARIWGHGDGNHVLQTGPGQYNERVFRALDYVVFQAGKNNVRLLMSVTTFWQDGDGILSYARWAGLTYPVKNNSPYYTEQWAAKDGFWNSGSARSLYRNNLKKLFNRKNSFSGRLYKNDAAIMGYGLFNEHRCPASQLTPGCVGRVTNWLNHMTKFAKSINKKQLFTVGEEGFYAKAPQCNPTGVPGNVQPGWASRVGQDFPTQHKYSDFMEYHLWPVNWATEEREFANRWIQCHVTTCKKLNKPCLLGEFGQALYGADVSSKGISSKRNPYFNTVYTKTKSLVSQSQPVGGTLFWQWVNDDKPDGGNSIKTRSSTFQKYIKPHAAFMAAKSGAQVCATVG